MGEPKKKIDEEQVLKLAERQWTTTQIAAFFRVSVDTIDRRFAAKIKQARQAGSAKLIDLQWKRALGGSDRMLIHMSKHYLGQHEKIETKQSITTNEVVIKNPSDITLKSDLRLSDED